MHLPGAQVIGIVTGASFAAGLNVYATVATIGLLSEAGVVDLPPSLQILNSWWVIGAALALFVLEFFADKIPAFDLLWNALQTFVRVPVAALLAWGATAQLQPWEKLTATALGALIALAAHGGKTAARAAVTPSPEPFTNIGLSVGEDAIAIFLTWFATQHPFATVSIVGALLLIIVFTIRYVWRAMKRLFRGAERVVVRESGAA